MEEEMRISKVFLYVVCLSLITTGLYSSTLVYMELKDILKRSEAVVRGVVRDVESRYNEERTKILTYTLIEIKETIYGKTPPVITVETYGGRVGDINMKVPGMPEFKKGEEVVLFVKKTGEYYHISGMVQGKYRVEKGEDEEEYLVNDFKDVFFKRVNAENRLEDMPPSEIQSRIRYKDFVKNIDSIVRSQEVSKPEGKKGK
jgi:hypothetical protein